jgi:hypothetical protein
MYRRMDKRPATRECRRGSTAPSRRWTATPRACHEAIGPSLDELGRYFRSVEAGESRTDFQRLLDAGIDLPRPSSLSDEEVLAKLWEVIGALAALRVYLSSTDHLGDRELYTALWTSVLRQEVEVLGDDLAVWQVDLVCGGGEQATHLYLKHYADERERRQWAEEFPGDPIPAHEAPSFQRDRRLPKP